ncbi:hypothetical protein WAZ07_04300 [Bacillus sp. FJAT-51639]|uniref:Uncharacterized protein n=1 Tax=Bacillus bruguierae TaxID=3127667 RepID=A0ABU8FF68_9BACI
MFNFFKKTNETKMEKLQAQQGDLQSSISKVESKLGRVQSALQLAETDLMLDESQTNKKRVEKYQKAIEEFNSEIANLQDQLNSVSGEISKVQADEELLRIEELAKQDAKGYEFSRRGYKAKELMERIGREIDRRTNYAGAGDPERLIRDVHYEGRGGMKYAPNNFQPYHHQENPAHVEVWEKETQEADQQINKDFEELQQAVNKYFGKELM